MPLTTRGAAGVLRSLALSMALLSNASYALSQESPAGQRPGSGTVNGQVTDESGAPISGATVVVESDAAASGADAATNADGNFSLTNIAAGTVRLTISATGFAARTLAVQVAAGEITTLPAVRLTLSLGTVSVEVTPSIVELAEQQIKEQEQQRLFGVFPNFRVSYLPDAAPLNSRQKFQLTWKSVADPTRFAAVGLTAAIQHIRNDYSEFGSGPDGYAKRYAALYATIFTGTMISNVALPALFKQDPRYFYRGTGTTSSRVGYALSRAVLRKSDSGGWQPDYSRVIGAFASGAISNYYYPAEHRRGIGLTIENAGLGIAGAAAGKLVQEFLFRSLIHI
jgi:hypothetical protein